MTQQEINGRINDFINAMVYKLYRKKYFNTFTKKEISNNMCDLMFILHDKHGIPLRHILRKLKIAVNNGRLTVMMVDISNTVIGQYILTTKEEEEIFIVYVSSFVNEHAKACIKVEDIKEKLFYSN